MIVMPAFLKQTIACLLLLLLLPSPIQAATTEDITINVVSETTVDDIEQFGEDVSPPKDGYSYLPLYYKQDSVSLIERYKLIDQLSVTNQSSGNVTVQYSQMTLVPVKWQVGSVMKRSAFQKPLLKQISDALEQTAKDTIVTNLDQAYPLDPEILLPDEDISIAVYQQAAVSSGTLYWKKYTPSGSLVGIYSQPSGLQAAPIDAITIDIVK